MKLIAVVATRGSGKDIFGHIVQEKLSPQYRVDFCSFSEVLMAINAGRDTKSLQDAGQAIDKALLHERTREYIERSQADVFVLAGVRTFADVDFVHSFTDAELVAIHVDDLEKRFRRIVARGQKSDDATQTWEAFLEREAHPIEQDVPRIMERADYSLDNSGTPEAFAGQISDLLAKLGLRER